MALIDIATLRRHTSFPVFSRGALASATASSQMTTTSMDSAELVACYCCSGEGADYDVADGSFILTHLNVTGETLSFLSVFYYARDMNNRLNAQHFAFCMRLHKYNLFTLDSDTISLTAREEWACRIVVDAGRRGVAVIAIARILRLLGCLRRLGTYIVCEPCLAVCSDLFDKNVGH